MKSPTWLLKVPLSMVAVHYLDRTSFSARQRRRQLNRRRPSFIHPAPTLGVFRSAGGPQLARDTVN
jgi:hypothetical protein